MPDTARRIAILLPDLRPGGAERLHLHLAEHWAGQGLKVEFVLRQKRGELLAQLPAACTVVDLGAARVRHAFWPLVRYLKREQPDALLAAMWPLSVIAPLAARLAGFKGRVLVSEHSPLSLAYAGKGWLHRFMLRLSQRLLYPLADARVAVSAGVADDLAALSGLPRSQFTVIYNPAALGRVPATPPARPVALSGHAGPVLLSVGTLKRVKRFDVLIDAFARLTDFPEALLCIVGEGAERTALQAQVAALGLQDRVLLPGYAPDPSPWYAHADLFVLSSDYEGFGNVIVEALEHGLAIVSTDCPSGPREILADGRYGRLVPPGDAAALAQAMRIALQAPRDVQAQKARASAFTITMASESYLRAMFPAMPGNPKP